MLQRGKPFPCAVQKYTKFANFTELYFPHFTIFSLFYYMNFPMSKVCLIRERSKFPETRSITLIITIIKKICLILDFTAKFLPTDAHQLYLKLQIVSSVTC